MASEINKAECSCTNDEKIVIACLTTFIITFMLSTSCFMTVSKFFRIKSKVRREQPERDFSFSNLDLIRGLSGAEENTNIGQDSTNNQTNTFLLHNKNTPPNCSTYNHSVNGLDLLKNDTRKSMRPKLSLKMGILSRPIEKSSTYTNYQTNSPITPYIRGTFATRSANFATKGEILNKSEILNNSLSPKRSPVSNLSVAPFSHRTLSINRMESGTFAFPPHNNNNYAQKISFPL